MIESAGRQRNQVDILSMNLTLEEYALLPPKQFFRLTEGINPQIWILQRLVHGLNYAYNWSLSHYYRDAFRREGIKVGEKSLAKRGESQSRVYFILGTDYEDAALVVENDPRLQIFRY